jgi:hypothetical protein
VHLPQRARSVVRRTCPQAYGLVDIWLTKLWIAGTGPAHGEGANRGCRGMREVRTGRTSQLARLIRGGLPPPGTARAARGRVRPLNEASLLLGVDERVLRVVLRSFAMLRFAESGRLRAEPLRAWKPVAPTDDRMNLCPFIVPCVRRLERAGSG